MLCHSSWLSEESLFFSSHSCVTPQLLCSFAETTWVAGAKNRAKGRGQNWRRQGQGEQQGGQIERLSACTAVPPMAAHRDEGQSCGGKTQHQANIAKENEKQSCKQLSHPLLTPNSCQRQSHPLLTLEKTLYATLPSLCSLQRVSGHTKPLTTPALIIKGRKGYWQLATARHCRQRAERGVVFRPASSFPVYSVWGPSPQRCLHPGKVLLQLHLPGNQS